MILLILPLGGSSYRVSEYIPLVVMHASSIHESFISRANSRPDILAGCYTNHLQWVGLCSSMAFTT